VAAWTQVARQVERRAAAALAAGHTVSAREAYLGAYTYNRAAPAFISRETETETETGLRAAGSAPPQP
jgi:hypothetical protein